MTRFAVGNGRITTFKPWDKHQFNSYFDWKQFFTQLISYQNKVGGYSKTSEDDSKETQQTLVDLNNGLIPVGKLSVCCVFVNEANFSKTLRNSVQRKQRSFIDISVLKNKISVRQRVEYSAIAIQEWKTKRELSEWKIA